MDILLDTNILIWAVASPTRLDASVVHALTDPANAVHFSAASIWEIAIKCSLKRSDFTADPGAVARRAVEIGFVDLPVRSAVGIGVAALRLHHRDPFGRLLIAEALAGPMHFYTSDAALGVYSDLVHVVR